MASENVSDWEEPMPSSESICEEESEDADRKQRRENLARLQKYVTRMAYRPITPHTTTRTTERLAKPRKLLMEATCGEYAWVQTPKERRQRFKRLSGKYTAITAEQLEQIVKVNKTKDLKKEDLLKRKQEIYYEMLTKLEGQCRAQYLNVLIKKFGKFIASLATTMRIPPDLIDPYARLQRGIFCNILLAIGVQNTSPEAFNYTTEEAIEFEVCHKLAHALLSIIIKALDLASMKNPEDIQLVDGTDIEMDRYIKDRLMCAAEKKINNERQNLRSVPLAPNPIGVILKQCRDF